MKLELVAIIMYLIFFIFMIIFGEYLEYVTYNEVYRFILVILYFFADLTFCGLFPDNKKLRIPYIILWILTMLIFPLIVIISFEKVLFIWIIIFALYKLTKFFIYKKYNKNPLDSIISDYSKSTFIITIAVLMRNNWISVI